MALKNLARGTHSAFGEKLDWTYYDTNAIANSTTAMRFFALSEGQGGKTRADTNMTAAGQIPTGQRLTIHRIKLMYKSVPYTTAEVEKFMNVLDQCVLTFQIPGKDSILTLSLQECFGISTLLSLIPAVTVNVPLPLPYFHGMYPLNKPIILAEQTQFNVIVTPYTAPAAALVGDRLRIGLNGILERRS